MYELGVNINGKRVVLMRSKEFPAFGAHDMLFAITKAMREAFPEAYVMAFQQHDGVDYSC